MLRTNLPSLNPHPTQWSARVFRNVAVVPPGTGMAHQVTLEHLSRAVCEHEGLLFPDSVVGTDSHVTMLNGLGVLGWGECARCPRGGGGAWAAAPGG